jgi:hypothetical protein
MKNIKNACILLVITITLASLISLLLDWYWIAAHWQRQLIVTVLIITTLCTGLYLAFVNLTIASD